MTPVDLIEIYGADPARWPIEHRAAALAVIAADPALQVELAEAAKLDALLGAWATRVPVRADAGAVAARILRPRWPRVAGVGGLIAAAVVAVVMVTPPATTPAPVATVATAAEIEAADDADFAKLFTPTPDEESLS